MKMEDFFFKNYYLNINCKTRKNKNTKGKNNLMNKISNEDEIIVYLFEEMIILTKIKNEKEIFENLFYINNKEVTLEKKEIRKFKIKYRDIKYSLKTDDHVVLNLYFLFFIF
jgi:hypothetical protein